MGGRHWSYEEVAKFFSDHQCTLLTTEYLGCNAKLQFLCPCGAEASTCFRQFKFSGGNIRCHSCAIHRKVEADKARHGGLHYFQTIEFWDYEVKRDRVSSIRRCLDFLGGSTPGNWPSQLPASPGLSSPE